MGLVPSEAALLGLWTAVLSLRPHTAVPLCASASESSLPMRTPVRSGQGLHFTLIAPLKARSANKAAL